MKLLHSLLLVLFWWPHGYFGSNGARCKRRSGRGRQGLQRLRRGPLRPTCANPAICFSRRKASPRPSPWPMPERTARRRPKWGSVFHFTLPPERLHPALGALLAGMNAQHQGYDLSVADALWAQKDENFLPGYLKLVQTNYVAGFHAVDFKTSPDSVRGTINQWVEKRTNDKIQNLLGPGAVTPLYPPDAHQRHLLQGCVGRSVQQERNRRRGFSPVRGQNHSSAHDAQHRGLRILQGPHPSRRSRCRTRRTKSRC